MLCGGQSAGEFQKPMQASATSGAAAYISGWRRPQRVRSLSDHWPIAGSMKASRIRVAMIAVPTHRAGKPITRLR